MIEFYKALNPLVSIIIPVKKDENIEGLIDSIKKSTYQHFEIIIVNMGLERSVQRNAGIRRAKGKYLLILDSDQYLSPGLLQECVQLAQVFGALYIPERIVTKGLFAYIRNWERQFYNGTPIDCVRFVHAKGCPKFDEQQTGPEDADFDRRVRGFRTITKNCFYHHDNIGLISYFKKKAYYSKSMARFAERNSGDEVLDWKWRCWKVFVEKGKWRRFFSRPDLVLAVMLIILIRGVIYVYSRNLRELQ